MVCGTQARIVYLSETEFSPIVNEVSILCHSDLTLGATVSRPQQSRTGPSRAIDKTMSTNWQPVEGSLEGSSLAVDWGSQRGGNRIMVSEHGNRAAAHRLQ